MAEYREQFAIRPGERLTSLASRERMGQRIRQTIAEGRLDAHFAGNASRAVRAGHAATPVCRALRAAGVAMPTPVPLTSREVIEAIVAAIEGGAKVATAVRRSPIRYSTFHAGLARHPDLKARMPVRSRR